MEIKLSLNKDVNQNAEFYFSKAKKLKAKLPGVEETIRRTKKEIEEFKKLKEEYIESRDEKKKLEVNRKKEWFDKFRSTRTSDGFLVVFGKDAASNEVLIKKHLEENDIVIHSEAPGSPFGIVKGAKDTISKQGIEEAAQVILCFSKQWKGGFGNADAFWVNPDQVTKKAQSGEFMSKGSFMIYGTKNILKNIQLRICLGVEKKEVEIEGETVEYEEAFSGSELACKKFCANRYVKLEPGQSKYKVLTKEIQKRLKFRIDDLPKYIPNEAKVLKK